MVAIRERSDVSGHSGKGKPRRCQRGSPACNLIDQLRRSLPRPPLFLKMVPVWVQQLEKLAAPLFDRLAMIHDPPGEPHKHCGQLLIIVERIGGQNGNPIGRDTCLFETVFHGR
jgi:hypothetical protein